MKSKMKSASLNTLSNLLTLNSSHKHVALSLNDMKKVRGGDGEDNGGSDIIIPFPK